jgi:hypothetical protein
MHDGYTPYLYESDNSKITSYSTVRCRYNAVGYGHGGDEDESYYDGIYEDKENSKYNHHSLPVKAMTGMKA